MSNQQLLEILKKGISQKRETVDPSPAIKILIDGLNNITKMAAEPTNDPALTKRHISVTEPEQKKLHSKS